MPGFLLDTNIVIHFLRHADSPVRTRLAASNLEQIFVCSVVKAELFFGAAKSNQPERSRAVQEAFLQGFMSFPFDDSAAGHYARIRAELERKGLPIGANDLMIASIALTRDLVLVTANLREFERVPGLQTENWSTRS